MTPKSKYASDPVDDTAEINTENAAAPSAPPEQSLADLAAAAQAEFQALSPASQSIFQDFIRDAIIHKGHGVDSIRKLFGV